MEWIRGKALETIIIAAVVIALLQIILPTIFDLVTDVVYWLLIYAAYKLGGDKS